VNISHSFLGWNKAHRNGGAVFVGTDEKDKSLNSTLRLVNTTFEYNLAEATGGAATASDAITCCSTAVLAHCHAVTAHSRRHVSDGHSSAGSLGWPEGKLRSLPHAVYTPQAAHAHTMTPRLVVVAWHVTSISVPK
jgi:hypothetical protein